MPGTSTLEATVGSFENRLQKKLLKKEEDTNREEAEANSRNARILQALNTIRRALQETEKIKLGDRFKLELEVNDWNGWPRLELNLIDALAPEMEEYGLLVTAHDRKRSGTVEFRGRTGMLYGELSLATEKELAKIPALLKRAVRSYLDTIAEYVLNPKSAEDIAQRKIEIEEEALDPEGQKLKKVDVFSDDELEFTRNQVRHETDQVEQLQVTLDK